MPGLYDFPNIGEDYESLSRITQPQMMPNAPLGAGGMAGMMYYQDKNRQDAMIQKAAQLAELNASMKAQAAQEYSAGSEGRMANINTENALAKNKFGNLGDLINTQTDTIKAGAGKASAARMEEEQKKLYKYANSWNNATDEEDKEGIRQQMIKDGVTKIGIRDLSDAPLDKLDAIMKRIGNEQINTPAQAQKLALERVKGANALEKEKTKQQAANERAAMYVKAKEKALEMKAQADKMRPETKSQWEAKMWEMMRNGEMSPEDQAAFNTYIEKEMAAIRERAALAPPRIDPDMMKDENGKPILKEAAKPEPIKIPPQNNSKTKDGWHIKGKGESAHTAIKEGKTHRIVGYNSDTKEYQLDDGTIIKAE